MDLVHFLLFFCLFWGCLSIGPLVDQVKLQNTDNVNNQAEYFPALFGNNEWALSAVVQSNFTRISLLDGSSTLKLTYYKDLNYECGFANFVPRDGYSAWLLCFGISDFNPNLYVYQIDVLKDLNNISIHEANSISTIGALDIFVVPTRSASNLIYIYIFDYELSGVSETNVYSFNPVDNTLSQVMYNTLQNIEHAIAVEFSSVQSFSVLPDEQSMVVVMSNNDFTAFWLLHIFFNGTSYVYNQTQVNFAASLPYSSSDTLGFTLTYNSDSDIPLQNMNFDNFVSGREVMGISSSITFLFNLTSSSFFLLSGGQGQEDTYLYQLPYSSKGVSGNGVSSIEINWMNNFAVSQNFVYVVSNYNLVSRYKYQD